MKGHVATRSQAISLVIAMLAALFLWLPAAHAQHTRVIDGIRINIGVVTARWAARFGQEKTEHPDLGQPGHDHHLVVSLTDTKTGTHIVDADVRAEVEAPNGQVESETLVAAVTSGAPDYSSVFNTHARGTYRITIHATIAAHTTPVVATFTWTNASE